MSNVRPVWAHRRHHSSSHLGTRTELSLSCLPPAKERYAALFCQLNSFTGHILLLATAFSTIQFALLLEFHAVLFPRERRHPKLSDMRLCPGHYPVAGQMRVAQLCKSPHTLANHQSHIWFIPGIKQNQCRAGVPAIKKTNTYPFWR